MTLLTQIFTHITPEVEYTYEEMNRRLNEPAPKKHVFNLLNKEVPLTIDFKYTVGMGSGIKGVVN